jgi:hypothetical protein
MRIETTPGSQGLPDWVFRPYMGVFYAIVIVLLIGLTGDAWNAVVWLVSPAKEEQQCFTSSSYGAYHPATGRVDPSLYHDFDESYGKTTVETRLVEEAGETCTLDQCDGASRATYTHHLEKYLLQREGALSWLHMLAGTEGLEKGWDYFSTPPHVHVMDGVIERLAADRINIKETGKGAKLLSLLMASPSHQHERPCMYTGP